MANRLSKLFQRKGKINTNDLPRIPDSQRVEVNSRLLNQCINQHKQTHNNERLTPRTFIKFLIRSFKCEIAGIFAVFLLSYAVKIFNTFCTSFLLMAITAGERSVAI